MDVVWTLQYLLPAPQYGGAIEHHTEAEYNAIRWEDNREKPSWDAIVSAWPDAEKTMMSPMERLRMW